MLQLSNYWGAKASGGCPGCECRTLYSVPDPVSTQSTAQERLQRRAWYVPGKRCADTSASTSTVLPSPISSARMPSPHDSPELVLVRHQTANAELSSVLPPHLRSDW